MSYQVISSILHSKPKLLALLFRLLNFSFSTLIYRIIRVRDFTVRKHILNRLVYKPIINLAHRLGKDLIIYNSRWRYHFILVDSSSYGIMMLSHEGNVPNNLFKILKRKKEEAVFIDVGAHHGSYTLALAPYCRLVVAIEPHPKNYKILLKNLEINRISNCILINCAATSRDGEITLYTSQFSDLHSIYKWRVESREEKIKVAAYKLDTLLLERLGLEKIDIIKIDVEGAEIEVLKGMNGIIYKHKPIIMIEVFQKNFEKVKTYLEYHKYGYTKLYESIDPITNEGYLYLLATYQNYN